MRIQLSIRGKSNADEDNATHLKIDDFILKAKTLSG